MAERTLQLVLHYDGTEFAGWQVQPGRRTVQGVLEATRETRPTHYHVALFPAQYGRFVADGGLPKASAKTYRVSRGDTLWGIARRAGSSVAAIKRANAMESAMIRPGQVLRLP